MRLAEIVALIAFWPLLASAGDVAQWKHEWPRTDFTRHNIDLGEVTSGGPPKDGIPPIDDPRFLPHGEVKNLGSREPVITIGIDGDFRAYPLRILIWHEIVNDVVGGVPISVTYCPLCNSSVVFDRRIQLPTGRERVLDFGTTGKLRKSDLVMYDRQTESWWQQFLGEAIVGELVGTRLRMIASRVESFERFKGRHPGGRILVPAHSKERPYGRNPYVRYDTSAKPFMYSGTLPDGIAPLAHVVVVGDEAWSLELLKARGLIETDELVLTWEPGQNSVLDASEIYDGRDIGNVVVQRRTSRGLEDAVYDVSFAFAFHAMRPEGRLYVR
ncbi:MAG: DUF3179 domain-containing protein [Alphaproteobacteria bacterium]